jgi:hypothetical protein
VYASSASVSANPTPQQKVGAGVVQHVIIIMMENEEYSSVIGSKNAPYENGLAGEYALATDFHAVKHPSLPNYIALTAGSTLTFTSDCSPLQCKTSSTSVFDLLDSKGVTWKSYAESMPKPCDIVASSGEFYAKHVPALYYTYVTKGASYCDSHVVPLGSVSTQSGQFYTDLKSGEFPSYAFVTPNICDDAHNCSLSVGDRWLSNFIPQIQKSPIYSSTMIFLLYDEGATSDASGGGGHIVCLVIGPSDIVAKTHSSAPYNDYSVLATIESIYGLGNLGRHDKGAGLMSTMFKVTI